MMDIKAKEKVINKRNQDLKRSSNRFLKVFMIIFISGYTIFFTSSFWMPTDYSDVNTTKIGKSITANDREVTLISWDYSKEDKKMEVKIEINSTAIDGVNRYRWSAVDKNKGRLTVEPIIETDNLVVLSITNVPKRWSAVSLRMGLNAEDQTTDEEFTMLKFYTSTKTVNRVSKIEKKTLHEYKKDVARAKISIFNHEVKISKGKIRNEEDLVSEAEKTIKSLETKKKYQTADEITKTDENILKVEGEISTAKDRIDEENEHIKEYKEKINKQEEYLKMLGD